jgi:Sigma-70, region 4
VPRCGPWRRAPRAVVVLRYVADLPEAEVAEILGCSLGTVTMQLSFRTLACRNQPAYLTLPGRASKRDTFCERDASVCLRTDHDPCGPALPARSKSDIAWIIRAG